MAESTQVLLRRLLSMVEAQGKEIQALRQEVRALKGSDPLCVNINLSQLNLS